jgi:hypothetical protein
MDKAKKKVKKKISGKKLDALASVLVTPKPKSKAS